MLTPEMLSTCRGILNGSNGCQNVLVVPSNTRVISIFRDTWFLCLAEEHTDVMRGDWNANSIKDSQNSWYSKTSDYKFSDHHT